MISNAFGRNLKTIRGKLDFTQEKLAKKLNIASSAIGMYEQCRREPNYNLLIKISEEFNISISNLLGVEKKFCIKAISLDRAIKDLIEFIKGQDKVILKGRKLAENEGKACYLYTGIDIKIEKIYKIEQETNDLLKNF